ncbi:MAG: DUF4349 domain-containing protein [Sphingomonadaceae bacterium]|nr:DUF4349 domain-containing protein [Sphingomonadaceae bacterium]
MSKTLLFSLFATTLLAACGSTERANEAEAIVEELQPVSGDDSAEVVNEFGFWAAEEQGVVGDPFGAGAPTAKDIANRNSVSKPAAEPTAANGENLSPAQSSIAYAYSFGFQIEQENIPDLQKAHVSLCTKLGTKCRVLRMSQAGSDGWDGYGELELQVEASQAQNFGDALSEPAEELGGEQISFVVDGEDLSETIIDAEARLASRLVLRDKLTGILRKSTGSVDELVKAEQAVAEVTQEIDATRSKLQELRNRIRYSAVSIQYNTSYGDQQIGFVQPVWYALKSIGSTLGMTVAAIVYLLTIMIPVVLLILVIRWVMHRFGWRMRFWKNRPKSASET